MDSYSLANHILRALLIWVLVYFTINTIPRLTIRKQLIVATFVATIYLITEYLLLPTYVPDFCNVVCPITGNIDTSSAMQQLKLQERAGPAVTPVTPVMPKLPVQVPAPSPVSMTSAPVVPAVSPAVPIAPVTVPVSPIIQPPVVPSAVPTAAPVIPTIPIGQAPPAPVATSVRGNY